MRKPLYNLRGRSKRLLYLWHRRLGFVACMAIILWGLSGICHPLMNWTQPRPATAILSLPPLKFDQIMLTPKEALARNGIERFAAFDAISCSDHVYYRVKLHHGDPPRYLDARDGAPLADGEAIYAAYLAREYLNDRTHAITAIERLTAFDAEYGEVNRLLPIYKVSFNRPDGMRVYVDTESARLGTLVNNTKRRLSWFFETFHNWTFLGSNGPLRSALMLIFAALALSTSLSGLLIYGLLWKRFAVIRQSDRRGALRRYHRQLGLLVSATMLSFSASGGLHAFVKLRGDEAATTAHRATAYFSAGDLSAPLSRLIATEAAVTRIALVRLDGEPCYRIMRADGGVDYLSVKGERKLGSDAEERYARQLADSSCKMGDARLVSITRIGQFTDEYGFIYKRLPVFKVQYDDGAHMRCYIDPTDGALAASFRDGLERFESWSFTRLHKWHFLNPLGTFWRDLLMIASALGNVAVAMLGATALFADRGFRGTKEASCKQQRARLTASRFGRMAKKNLMERLASLLKSRLRPQGDFKAESSKKENRTT